MTVASFPQSRPRVASLLRTTRRESAFTLVEVSLAIGIVAFAFVAIFGLLPVGMNNFRKALDTSLTTQISQQIINDLKQSDFAATLLNQHPDRYYDDQGVDVTPKDSNGIPTGAPPAAGVLWLYYGQIIIPGPTTTLPGTDTPPSSNLLTVTIKLGANPGHRPTPFDTGSKLSYRTFIALIARN